MKCLFLLFAVAFQAAGAGNAALECPSDTTRRSFAFSTGGVSEWCALPNGLRQGPARSYYSNGHLLSSGEFSDGSAHGVMAYYLNEGTIWRRDVWDAGTLTSEWLNPEVMALSREELERRGAVGGGSDIGAAIGCAPGDRQPECRTSPGNPVLVLRYPGGRRRAHGSVSDGLRTGLWTSWYASGAVAIRAEFSLGHLSGSYQEWYENGRPSAEGQYLSGEKVGLWLYWSRTGKMRRERHGA